MWLAPLEPPDEAAELLRQTRRVAEAAGYFGLLEGIGRLEQT